jgi:hypothetical protein
MKVPVRVRPWTTVAAHMMAIRVQSESLGRDWRRGEERGEG